MEVTLEIIIGTITKATLFTTTQFVGFKAFLNLILFKLFKAPSKFNIIGFCLHTPAYA